MGPTLLEYNTHLFGDSIPGWLRQILEAFGTTLTFLDTERAASIIQRVNASGAAVVGLCEVWDDSLAAMIIAGTSPDYPYSYRPVTNNTFPAILGSGLLLLSQQPLTNNQFYGFNNLAGVDKYSHKGIAVSTTTIGGASVIVVLTHTQAPTDAEGLAVLKANVIQLTLTIKDLTAAAPATPLVLFGDLNIIAEDPDGQPTAQYKEFMALFAEAGLIDAYRKLYPDAKQNRGITYDGVSNNLIPIFAPADVGLMQRLDYFMPIPATGATATSAQVVTHFKAVIQGTNYDLSDHDPLTATFTF